MGKMDTSHDGYYVYMERGFPIIYDQKLYKQTAIYGPDTEDACQSFVDEWAEERAEELVCMK